MEEKQSVNKLVDHLFRKEYGRLVAFLTHFLGEAFMGHAEDIAQDTLTTAYQHWSYKGIPDLPSAWIFKVARNKSLNFIQKEKHKFSLYETRQVPDFEEEITPTLESEVEDSVLRMIFACCSPKISYDNQILLILNTLGGFSRREIANALLLNEEVVKKRLFRMKKEIRTRQIQLEVPTGNLLKPRINAVFNALYLLFNEGYNSSNNDELIRKDICLEAMRLTKLMVDRFENETLGKALFALMCFHTARFESRLDQHGAIILFDQQNRMQWNQTLIQTGIDYLAEASIGNEISSYHIEANIAAEHLSAASFEQTNWHRIEKLYTWLYLYRPSPIIKLNLAIVSSKTQNISFAIKQLKYLQKSEPFLANHYLLHATLGEFYKETKNTESASFHLSKAKNLTKSNKEIVLLEQKLQNLSNK